MYERLILLRELLSDTGTIIVHLDYHKCHHLRLILDEVFGAMNWTSDYKEIKGNLYCGIGCRENTENKRYYCQHRANGNQNFFHIHTVILPFSQRSALQGLERVRN